MRKWFLPVVLLLICLPAMAAESSPNLRMTNEVRVYQMVKDAVVNISSTKIVTARVSTGDEVFDRFFGGQIRQVPAQSLGSGFVIHPAGYIVTNEHVIDEATDVQVSFASGEKLEATVLATDNEHDLAVLKVNPKRPLTAIQLGASDDLMIGEPVYAIGNPFGYSGTMTRGIVSAVNRTLEMGDEGGGGGGAKSYKGLIQTDASINPGNSGGPLLNAYGQVIGVNTAIRADAHGIGFAIAVSNMRDLLPAFLNPQAMNRAQLGFTVEEKRVGSPPANLDCTVLINHLQADSGAEKAGLRVGDEILAVDKTPVHDVVDALVAMAAAQPGTDLSLEVRHAGKRGTLIIPVTKAEPPTADNLLALKMGIEGETLTPALARRYHLPISRGVLITAVNADSSAAAAGLAVGDVIYQLGPYYVNSVEDVATLLKTVKEAIDVRIGIVRNNSRGRGIIRLR